MADRAIKVSGPDHPITIEANPSRVVVKVGGEIIADKSDALTVREASYPSVQDIPRRDVDMASLTRSEHDVLPPQGRRVRLQHPGWWGSLRQCGVDIRDPV
jgi:uncharacterized protein (DUF427 family)